MTRRSTASTSVGLALALVCLAGCGTVDANRPGLALAVVAPATTGPTPTIGDPSSRAADDSAAPHPTTAVTPTTSATTATPATPATPAIPTNVAAPATTPPAVPTTKPAAKPVPTATAKSTAKSTANATANATATAKATPKPVPKPSAPPAPKLTPPPPPAPPAPSPPPVTTPVSDPSWQACQPQIGAVTVAVGARQRSVTVVNGNGGTTATVTFAIRTNTPCGFVTSFTDGGGRVGYGGLASGATRQQGTGTTPTGTYSMTEAFGINASPGSALPYRRVAAGDYWVEDNNSGFYNSYRNVSQGGFDATLPLSDPNGSERLSDYPGQYAYVIVVNFNRAPDTRVPYRGAGIFLHVRGSAATAGCVAVSSTEMVTMLRLMRPGDTVTIVP